MSVVGWPKLLLHSSLAYCISLAWRGLGLPSRVSGKRLKSQAGPVEVFRNTLLFLLTVGKKPACITRLRDKMLNSLWFTFCLNIFISVNIFSSKLPFWAKLRTLGWLSDYPWEHCWSLLSFLVTILWLIFAFPFVFQSYFILLVFGLFQIILFLRTWDHKTPRTGYCQWIHSFICEYKLAKNI